MIFKLLSMFQKTPFKPKQRYFIKTVTFYYIATFVEENKGFLKFGDVVWIENIGKWNDFVAQRPHLPNDIKYHRAPDLLINQQAILDVTPW